MPGVIPAGNSTGRYRQTARDSRRHAGTCSVAADAGLRARREVPPPRGGWPGAQRRRAQPAEGLLSGTKHRQLR